ncbi:MAG: hypothetical protein AAF891_01235 [Pseudomonadota bacterium]
MNRTVRLTLAPIVGLIAGIALVAVVQAISHLIFEAPQGVDLSTPEAVSAFMATVPLGAKLGVVLSWAAGMFGGGWVARRIAPGQRWVYSSVIALLLLLTCMNFVTIPHPVWMIVAPFVIAYAAWWVLDARARTTAPAPLQGDAPGAKR